MFYRLLNEQNREAHEMDGILREQLMEAYDRQEKRVIHYVMNVTMHHLMITVC